MAQGHGPHDSTSRPAATVLFIAGTGHSGSTLVANMLGAMPAVVCVGELRYLWERGLQDRGRCGCGLPVPDCAFWSAVLDRAQARHPRAVETASFAEAALLRVRHLPKVLRAHGRATELGSQAAAYTEQLSRVVHAVQEVAGASIVVDSSKLPTYGYLLSRTPGVHTKVLHLIRDPRAAAYSWSKARSLPPETLGPHRIRHEGPAKSVALWDLWNAVTERLWGSDPGGYVRLRYEDVSRDPRRALEPVLRMMGMPSERLPIDDSGEASIPLTHTVAGNPNRLRHGTVRIATDDLWLDAISRRDKAVVTAMAGPLLRHYGYAFGPPSPAIGTS